MFAKLFSPAVALVLSCAATAQQMPMPAASKATVTPAAIGAHAATASSPVAKVEPSKPSISPAVLPKADSAKVAPTLAAPSSHAAVPVTALQPSTKVAAPPAPAGALSIKQVADAQRLELAAETAQKLGLATPQNAIPLPAADIVKPYRAPKQYPKIEYVAGTVGEEKVGFRMPDGELLTLTTGNSIRQWRIAAISNGKVLLEMPAKKVAAKAKKRRKAKPPVTRTMSVGQSLK